MPSKKPFDYDKWNKELEEKRALATELLGYAELEGSEWGQTAANLANFWYSSTLLSDRLRIALEKEIKAWVEDVRQNTVVEEEEEEHTTTHKSKHLVWTN